MRRSKMLCLFDHLIGAQQEGLGHLEAEHLGGGEIEDQVELGRLLDRQVAGLCAAQNLIDIVRGAAGCAASPSVFGPQRRLAVFNQSFNPSSCPIT
jgi:hypothetical protein